ncbi:MAG: tandem-95 repeat protein [Fimbriimonadaceae bacterium]|nr:tandem-95 repeat protein [Fimbriimonadaceae bacterium]
MWLSVARRVLTHGIRALALVAVCAVSTPSASAQLAGWGKVGQTGTIWGFRGMVESPVPLENLSAAVSVGVSRTHSVAIGPTNSAWRWGRNLPYPAEFTGTGGLVTAGALTVTSEFLQGENWFSVDTSSATVVGADHTVWTATENASSFTRRYDLEPAAYAAGGLILLQSGEVRYTSGNSTGIFNAQHIAASGSIWAPQSQNLDRPARYIAALASGQVVSWDDYSSPYVNETLSGTVQVACNTTSYYALTASGFVYCFPSPYDSAQLIPGISQVVQIAAGEKSCFAIRSDGTLWAWGYDDGRLGLGGPATLATITVPQRVSELSNVTGIWAGGDNAFAMGAWTNVSPEALDDSYNVSAAGYLESQVTSNDIEPSGILYCFPISTPPYAEDFSFDFDGSFIYRPWRGFGGLDKFEYVVFDGFEFSLPATVWITVAPIAITPAPDQFTVRRDTLKPRTWPGVLENDSSSMNGLSAVLASPPSHADWFNLYPDGTVSYRPAPGFVGIDYFTYRVFDGRTLSIPTTVTVTVTGGNRIPIGVSDYYGATSGQARTIPSPGVLHNDVDLDGNALSAQLLSPPTGFSNFSLNADGTVSFTAPANFTVSRDFSYRVFDGSEWSAPITSSISPTAPRYDIIATIDTPYAIGDCNDFGDWGVTRSVSGNARAYLSQGGQQPTLGGQHGYVTGINNYGIAVGFAERSNGTVRAVVYGPGPIDLGTLGGDTSKAYDIGDNGWIAGEAQMPNGETHACLWQNRVSYDLGTLGGSYSLARCITKEGEVYGWAESDEGRTLAFRWTETAGMVPLETPTGFSSFATGAGSNGFGASAPVGWIENLTTGSTYGVIWSPSGALLDVHATLPGRLIGSIEDLGVGYWQASGQRMAAPPVEYFIDDRLSGTIFTEFFGAGCRLKSGAVMGLTGGNPKATFLVRSLNPAPDPGYPRGRGTGDASISKPRVVGGEEILLEYRGENLERVSLTVTQGAQAVSLPGIDFHENDFPLRIATQPVSTLTTVTIRLNPTAWDPVSVTFDVVPGDTTLSGFVSLQDYAGVASGIPLTIELRQLGTNTVVGTWPAILGANSRFALASGLPTGTYDVVVKASHWLARRYNGIHIGAANPAEITVSLINGDCDGDNEVAIGDYSLLSLAYGSSPGEPRWNGMADLDGDSEINIGDYSILSVNYGLVGD